MNDLNNKVSIITGASSGIGRQTCLLFSMLGSKIVLVGRSEQEINKTIEECKFNNEEEINANTLRLIGDLTDPEFCKRIVQETINKFHKIDILVNCAGILLTGTIETMSIKDYELTMDVNVKSAILLTQYCLSYLIKQKGSIVNVSSVTGTRSFPGVLAYCISKSAMDQFTKCTALELADKGVRVNSVNPGVIITNIHRRAGQTEEQYAKFLEHCKQTHALGRPGTGDEVAKAIAFLASDNASFITGELLHVDGGRHAMCPR